jgi:hypothetical protein
MMTIVWSCGGGRQSAAIAKMIVTGELPKPDLICIADTSREVQSTWEYLSQVIQPSIKIPIHIIPHSYAYVDLYKDDKNNILIPAFTKQSGQIGKLPTYCSVEWKQRPVRRWLREQGIEQCDLWIGISTNEAHRMKAADRKWINHVYPLIEINPTSLAKCISMVESFGWPTPPKSRCFMCPNMSIQNWYELKTTSPIDFQKAVDLEKQLQKKDKFIYLHQTGKPLNQAVTESEQQLEMFDGCDSGFCWN